MLLLSPATSKAHLIVLSLPALVYSRGWVERWPCCRRGLLVALAITGPLSASDLVGDSVGDVFLAWGFPTWFAVMLLAAMWSMLRASGSTSTAQRTHAAEPARRAA
jgi:hypothetical protein